MRGANHCRVTVTERDVLDEPPPDADVIVAGDCFYDAGLADRLLPWLRRAQASGIDILIGDPGRRYLPTDALDRARPIRRPDHHRARGSRPQAGPRLHYEAGSEWLT